MILIFVNELAGPTGYHKSVVETTNALHRAGYPIAVLSFLGNADGSDVAIPGWPLDPEVPVFTLQTLAAEGGRLLHRNYHPVFTARLGAASHGFTENQLASLRQLNALLSEDDTIIFTAPIPAFVFHHAVGNSKRRVRTVLQIHNDYQFHDGLWKMLLGSRGSIDRLQTVSSGLRPQFVPLFDDADVVFVPNVPGTAMATIEPIERQFVNIALPASFQHRKNQLDAVRALALIPDESVHLTLWGTISPLNPYYLAVRQEVESLGLTGRVHMPGFGSEAEIYSSADIVLLTSLSEGFGYPLIEAAYHQLPAVAFDFEFGPRDAILDGESGYIVPLGDVKQLADRLSHLAADPVLRERFGHRARELFDREFSVEAVVQQYLRFLGPLGRPIDLIEVFSARGGELVSMDSVGHSYRKVRGRNRHRVTVATMAELHDVHVDDGTRLAEPKVERVGERILIEFHARGSEVISYSTEPGSDDRHYLANTRGHDLEILPYLRRDAGYGESPVQDAIFAASGGARRLSAREFGRFAKGATGDVIWKIRQLREAAKRSAHPEASPESSEKQNTPGGVQRPQNNNGIARAIGVPNATLVSIGQVATAAARRGITLVVRRLSSIPPAPTRREIARHPWFPVTSGVDNFGNAINQAGTVQVRNDGSRDRPTVSIRGEYDWVVLRDAQSERRISAPYSYGEIFERICDAERSRGLFEITSRNGVYLWELGRSALIIQLVEAAGLWGPNEALGSQTLDAYDGPKRLTTAPRARRVVFDYARRGQSGYRTAAHVDDETLFVVQPEATGYPEVDDTNLVYPFYEFNRWRESLRGRWSQLRVPEVDARPFEAALTEALGVRVDLGDHLRNRLAKFLAEREFWTPVFERVKPEEVLIASSHWWAGIAAAAERSGARVSDIQYALTSHYAPSFWFGSTPHYGATRLYAWSEYWAARTNVYQEHVIVPRQQEEFAASRLHNAEKHVWDVCVIAQPRVLRRILAFVQDLVRERPDLKVIVAPHPAQRLIIADELAAAGLAGKVAIAEDDTLTTIGRSALSVGTFSTSLWESAALGCPTYVIPVPGYEETLQDIESGLFRLASSPYDLVPYDVPESRHAIFGNG
ncbi:glycosyltransferase [Humibacter albus]|uniref:glycosyltransferase n=1 Tax=Humibacter albus TaxID=427754 RepID=UPI000525C932|nr:glycosyltransferase [Humibacter albus]